jgi:flavodoxin I
MKALVVYDSVFGNTEKIAHAITHSLGSRAQVEVLRAATAAAGPWGELDLLLVGSPTRGFRPTEPVSTFLKMIRAKGLGGTKVAAFDTRYAVDELHSAALRLVVKTGGYAATRIAGGLQKAGGDLVAPPEAFFVEGEKGPLRPGELERAALWASSISGTR